MAETAMQGMRPSGPQPKGSPQLAQKGSADLKAAILELNRVAETMRMSGLTKSNDYVLDIIECTRKLQGIVVSVEKEMQQLQQGQAQGMPQQGGY